MSKSNAELEVDAARIRIGVLKGLRKVGAGHIGGSMSMADLMAVLYGGAMNVKPEQPDWKDRDWLVVSKGHCGPAVYATLALHGYFPEEELETINQGGTNLPSHCDRNKTPGIDMTTGSLGQGCSLAVGLALGDALKGRDSRVFLISGDGEINEGQVWEAAMLASARKVDNLYWFIDLNKKQLDGPTEEVLPLGDVAAKFAAFGFDTQFIPGNDIEAIYTAIEKASAVKGKPHAIVLDTIKGSGVRGVVETAANHSITAKAEVYDEWLAGLNAAYDAFKAQ